MLQQGSVNANNVRNLFNVEMVKLRDHFLNSIVALVTLNDKLLFCGFFYLSKDYKIVIPSRYVPYYPLVSFLRRCTSLTNFNNK